MKLFSYWGSPATYRVRFALAIKGLDAELTMLDLLKGDH
jgi:glutathione S-transferase